MKGFCHLYKRKVNLLRCLQCRAFLSFCRWHVEWRGGSHGGGPDSGGHAPQPVCWTQGSVYQRAQALRFQTSASTGRDPGRVYCWCAYLQQQCGRPKGKKLRID